MLEYLGNMPCNIKHSSKAYSEYGGHPGNHSPGAVGDFFMNGGGQF